MMTLRARKIQGRVPLFSMYSSESEEVLSVLVGTSIALHYQDITGRPVDNSLIDFPINIDDEKWVSNSVQFYSGKANQNSFLGGIALLSASKETRSLFSSIVEIR